MVTGSSPQRVGARASRGPHLLRWVLPVLVLALASGLVGFVGADGPPPGSPGTAGGDGRAEGHLGAAFPVHTELEATFPAADSLYRGRVTELRLRYTTEVQLPLSTVRLLRPDGERVQGLGLDTVPGTGGAELRMGFEEPLASGRYTVEWRTAGPDDHPIQGTYGFEVERPAPPAGDTSPADTVAEQTEQEPGTAEPGAAPAEGPALTPTGAAGSGGRGPGPAEVAVRWLFFASIVGMLGVTVFRFTVLPTLAGEAAWEEAALAGRDRLLLLALGAGILGIVALPGRFLVQWSLFSGGDAGGGSVAWAVLTTGWGLGWAVQAGALALFAWGIWLVARRPRIGWSLMLGGGALATLVPALAGHSRSLEPPLRSLATVIDALHVAAASIWLGGLSALVLVGIGAARRAGGPEDGRALPRVVDAFSRVALAAVAGLLATGVANAWLHLGSFGALWSSGYGRTLLVKLVLVAAVAALGFYNWRFVRPALRESPRAGLIRGPASLELAVGAGVLLVTAVLVATPLPGG